MNLKRLINTLKYLKPVQISHQVLYRFIKPRYIPIKCTQSKPLTFSKWIDKYPSYDPVKETFTFLNITDAFHGWSDKSHGMLWAYNLNYMDWLLQPGLDFNIGVEWIDKFIKDIPENTVGLDPYPTALRCINWIKFISLYSDKIEKDRWTQWNDSLLSQYKLLGRRLEFHLLGNHLLEDLFSIFIGSLYFCNKDIYRGSCVRLSRELTEQILGDGAHYEQSPMYHCILLDRLLDCINFDGGTEPFLIETAKKMLGHLENAVWSDKTIPHINDSADGIAPSPCEIFKYAERLGIDWKPMPMRECGYRKLKKGFLEAIIDVGDITSSYQPGHSHADTFNYELRIDGRPFVVDTGISTYDKTSRRQYERSTLAHNTVMLEGKDSSEVWGGFRVGKRAKVKLICDNSDEIIADHDGYTASIHQRRFVMDSDLFCVTDKINGKGMSLIHLAPDVKVKSIDNSTIVTDMAIIRIERAVSVDIMEEKTSTEYNIFKDIKVIHIEFNNRLIYKIIPRL